LYFRGIVKVKDQIPDLSHFRILTFSPELRSGAPCMIATYRFFCDPAGTGTQSHLRAAGQ
jgi:hypothetical protein